jgi:hypothetical protein
MKLKEYLIESSIDEIPNNNLLTEAGLSRLLNQIKKKDFFIITAFRGEFDKSENIKRNRKLRSDLNSKKMGPYQLIGHWRECQDSEIDYNDCPENMLVDVIERSYLVTRPESMNLKEFKIFVQNLTKKYNQDASIISMNDSIHTMYKDGNMDKIGSGVTLNKISQAYSQHVKKQNLPFVFEAEVPSSNSGRMMFKKENVKYPLYEKNEVRNW